MKIEAAVKLIEGIVREHVRERFAVNANLFGKGIVRSERTEADYRQRQRVEDAWRVILEAVEKRPEVKA
jgi:hypothetical protein